MTLTLLFDLDNTLLGNDIDIFLAHYTKALAGHLASYADPARLVNNLMSATKRMLENQDPSKTLEEVFDAAFYPALGVDKADLIGPIQTFYQDVFPKLKGYTQLRPEAIEVVENALARGYRIAVATNPLFPSTAILQRLSWAGLPADQVPFALIPSYDTFHFAKPNPAFYAEFLAQMGWPGDPIVMVGNDLVNDIAGARKLGLCAFWIIQDGVIPSNGPEGPSAIGRLPDLLPWIDSTPLQNLQPNFNSPEAFLSILRATPPALDSIGKRLAPPEWTRRPEPDEWSLTEIFCHLRDVEGEVNLPRLEKMVLEQNPFLPGMDTDPWAEQRQYNRQDCADALDTFTQSRRQVLSLLDNISPTDWMRSARHAILGPTQLQELVSIMAGHDRLHVQQAIKVFQAISA